MKKILYVASEFATGMIPFAAKIISVMNQDSRYEVFAVVVNSGRYSYKERLRDMDDDHLIQIEYPRNKLLKLSYKFYPRKVIEAIGKIDREQHVDVIHLLTGDFTLAPYVMMRSELQRSKWYYTVHDLHPHEMHHNLYSMTLRNYILAANMLLRSRIHNLTTSSKSQYDELKRIYPDKHIEFTHFPSLITSQIQNGINVVPELMKEKEYILFFGNVNKYKGVDLLINAYLNSKKLQSMKLVIAGKGQNYEKAIDNNRQILRINRFIDDSEIRDLFRKALFVVYPYRSATMSGVLSIAYYFRKRVLLSSIPFFLENATSASVFFKNGDIADLQKQLEKLADEEYDNTAIEKCYEDIYSDNVLNTDYNKLYLV